MNKFILYLVTLGNSFLFPLAPRITNLAAHPPANKNVIMTGNPKTYIGARVENIQLSSSGRLPAACSNSFYRVEADWP